MLSLIYPLTFLIGISCAKEFYPKDSQEFSEALQAASPYDSIYLMPIDYIGDFIASSSGRPNGYIMVHGSQDHHHHENHTRLINPNGPGLTVTGGFWNIVQLKIEDSIKGLLIQDGGRNKIEAIYINNVQEEAILVQNSSENSIRSLFVRNAGWGIVLGNNTDHTVVTSTKIGPTIVNHGVVISQSSCCGLWKSNYIDSSGHAPGIQSSVKVHGDNHIFSSTYVKGAKNGWEIDQGCGNRFRSNYCYLRSEDGSQNGYCILVGNPDPAPSPPAPVPADEFKPICTKNIVERSNWQVGGAGVSNNFREIPIIPFKEIQI